MNCYDCGKLLPVSRSSWGARNCAACSQAWRAKLAREDRRYATDYMPAQDRRALRSRGRS